MTFFQFQYLKDVNFYIGITQIYMGQ